MCTTYISLVHTLKVTGKIVTTDTGSPINKVVAGLRVLQKLKRLLRIEDARR